MHRPSAQEFLLKLLETMEDLPPDFARRFEEVLKKDEADRSQAIRSDLHGDSSPHDSVGNHVGSSGIQDNRVGYAPALRNSRRQRSVTILRSASAIGASLMLATRRRMSPSPSNSHSSTP